MSALHEAEVDRIPRQMMARRVRVAPAPMAVRRKPAAEQISPTTSIQKVLLTIGVALLLGLVLNARSVVHDANGMPDGIMRDATLFAGEKALSFAEATHLTWPRDEIDRALDNNPQPAIPPLLQIGALASPVPFHTPRPRETGVSLAAAVHLRMTSTPVPPTPTATRVRPKRADTPVPPARQAARSERAKQACPGGAARSTCKKPAQGAAGHPQLLACRVGGHNGACRPHPAGTPLPAITLIPATFTPTPIPPSVTPTRIRPTHTATRVPHTPTAVPTATATVAPTPPRAISAADPLRLLVTGDSLSGYLGPELVDEAATAAPVTGFVDTHDGTGLTRPDFVDWSILAQQQVAKYHPDAVVVIMGGNDFQNMTLPNGAFFTAGTPAWTKEYARRAEICMRIWAQGGAARVYWLSMPPARNTSWAHDDRQINIALRAAAARVPDVRYLNILGPVTDHGKYVDFVRWHGQWILIREPDGVHLNSAGSDIVAGEVLAVLRREWRLP